MKTLLVMRHAKSDRSDPAVTDHERPLAPRGRRAVPRVAGWLTAQGLVPAYVRCSSARRTRETLELLAPVLDDAVVEVDEGLYLATGEELVTHVRALPPDAPSALLIGHNPGVQQLLLDLAARSPARRQLEGKFPTGAVAALSLPVSRWTDVRSGQAELAAYVTPHELA